MAFDAHKNLAVSTVTTAPSPATSGTSLVVTASEGARFPAPPFNATVWPSAAMPTPANAEVVRVTARASDTLTIVRAQEGTTARAMTAGDLIAASITAKTLTDLETQAALKDAPNVFTQPQTIQFESPYLSLVDPGQPVGVQRWQTVNAVQDYFIQPTDAAGAATLNPLRLTRAGDALVHRNLHEHGRATALGHWIAEPYNDDNFSGLAPMTWDVGAGAHTTNRYTLIGQTLVWTLAINGGTLGGTATQTLKATLPGGRVLAATMLGATGFGNIGGTWQPIMIQCTAGNAYLDIFKADASPFALGTVYIDFTLTLEIQ